MSLVTNMILILLGINLMIFVFGSPENNSPMLGLVKGIATGSWGNFFYSLATSSWIYIVLIGLVALAAYATGANPLTGGGGYGAVLVLQILGIAVVFSILAFPNFATFGFPAMIEYTIDIVMGGFIVVIVIALLRGY